MTHQLILIFAIMVSSIVRLNCEEMTGWSAFYIEELSGQPHELERNVLEPPGLANTQPSTLNLSDQVDLSIGPPLQVVQDESLDERVKRPPLSSKDLGKMKNHQNNT